jgi:hypothetical protein
MKLKVVPSSWFEKEGRRLDCGPYLSGSIEAKVLLEKLSVKKVPLREVTAGFGGGIYNGPQFVRNYVNDLQYGIPFLTSGTILASDLSRVGLLSKGDAESTKLRHLRISEGMTLITCSGTKSVGRLVYARPEMEGMWSSQDVLKVVPDPSKILPGYLYAYLSSRFGVPLVVSGIYGAIIQHIEPLHIADLPVPLLSESIVEAVHHKIVEAAKLRGQFRSLLTQATEYLFSAVGLKDITASTWHSMKSSSGFAQSIGSAESIRALNFNPRFQHLKGRIREVHHISLGEICKDGELRSGLRFKRVDCDREFGVKLIGQRELFWMEPEGRWISSDSAPKDIFVEDETIVVAAQGTLGENEVFGRAEFITGDWLKYVYTQHLLRIRSGMPNISNAFLFAFMRSETAFRFLRSISVGSKQQDFHRSMLARLPIPLPDESLRDEISNLVRSAYKLRHEASRLEAEGISLIEQAIESNVNAPDD